ncbi:hypothetical protein ACFQ6E_38855 [Streptomyces sp. NPDC056462]|uniref:hypothetical protein n=1 Tax=Streptomyces sp. NPDC056462 TaxID=3345826 RepID=UPI0036B598FE
MGSADSEEPLLLPLEAIEVDAFRQRHEGDTFWCGVLLGGCGGQLTTKLYTDRVCHFAHHPGPDGMPHVCERHARDVSSADHLYMKAAAADWLTSRGHEARFAYARPGGVPIGSVLDIEWAPAGRCLRVHLDAAVDPVWDDDQIEPVLGVSVPVDDETLVRRWYVHRVRFDSVGTARQVRIGTEAFARPTEWFGLDDCEVTEEGLRTPAVERIVRSRRTPAPRQVTFSRTPAAGSEAAKTGMDERVRRFRDAVRAGSVPAVTALCSEFDAGQPLGDGDEDLAAALKDARAFLDRQREVRGEMVKQLWEAVGERTAARVRSLLVQVETAVGHDRCGRPWGSARRRGCAPCSFRSRPLSATTVPVRRTKSSSPRERSWRSRRGRPVGSTATRRLRSGDRSSRASVHQLPVPRGWLPSPRVRIRLRLRTIGCVTFSVICGGWQAVPLDMRSTG